MAERSLRAEQVPGFEDSPVTGPRITDPERELPETATTRRAENPRLNEAAENIGRTAGRAVAKIREFPHKIEEVREDARQKLREIRSQSQAGRLSQLKDQAGERLEILKNRANERVLIYRSRAQRMTRERPLAVIAGAFAISFMLGVVLRIWRSND